MTVQFPIDLQTPVGTVRLLIPDRGPEFFFFQDEELTALLAIEAGSTRLAAALALETIASDTAMVDKVIKIMDLETDGAKVLDALLKRAALLRQQAEDGDLASFALLEFSDLTVFNAREYRRKRGDGAGILWL